MSYGYGQSSIELEAKVFPVDKKNDESNFDVVKKKRNV